MVGTLVRGCRCATSWSDLDLTSAILNLENVFIKERCFACSVKRQSKLMASQKGVEILTSLLRVCLSNCLQDLKKKLVDQKSFIKNQKKKNKKKKTKIRSWYSTEP